MKKETLFDSTMRRTQEHILKNGSMKRLAEKLDTNLSTITRWFAEKGRSPRFDMLAKIFEELSIKIVFPDDPSPHQTEAEALSAKVEELQARLAETEKERDTLRIQIEILKDILRPQTSENEKKDAG